MMTHTVTHMTNTQTHVGTYAHTKNTNTYSDDVFGQDG